ncbi:MAG: EAL domain-containing protein [Congregibacter sp.]
MISHQSIRNKLLSINLLATVFALLLSGVFWVYIALQNYTDYFDERIASQARLVASNASAAVLFEDWDEAAVILSALATDPAITGARILLEDATSAYSIEFQATPQMRRLFALQIASFRQQTGSIRVPVEADSREIAKIELTYHTNEIYEAFVDITLSLISTAGVAMILGALLLLPMQSVVTRPLKRLSVLARDVTESKNYALRGEVTFRDEIGQLTEDFNSMLDIIERRDTDLESKVQERTQQLATKNVELEHEISERARSEEEKREIEARFEQAFINAPIGMALVDEQQRTFRFNAAFSRTLDINNIDMLYLHDFIESAAHEQISQYFKGLVNGEKTSFSADASCISGQGMQMSVVLSFSAIRNDQRNFRYAVLQLQDITESKKLSEELEYQAQHDVLTGLPNRRILKEALAAAAERTPFEFYALGFLDLDQFKVVNDACGHMAGDELLRQVAHIIANTVGPEDLVVRLGGDEFAVLLTGSDDNAVHRIAENIREAIESWEYNFEGKVFRVGASIGVVVVTQPMTDISVLMNEADTACFVAKDQGRNRVHIIQGEDREVHERQGEMRWVQRLHDALDGDRFVLYAQPVVALNAECDGERKEILLRMWDDRGEQPIPPGAFIPAAERYGLMDKIDRWVIQRLIKLLKDDHSLHNAGQSYWVNLSGLSLGNTKFLSDIEIFIKTSELPVGTVNFEITETAVMNNIAEARKFMESLKELGCRFALDDFGSGMSSFGYLKNLPVDYIKIDGMFVRDIVEDEVDLIFVKSIIDIAKVMGIETIAEYVESEAIKRVVEDLGTDFGQGYALGKPVPLISPVSHTPLRQPLQLDRKATTQIV